MWIPSHLGISSDVVADELARQAVESGTVHGQMMVANDYRILATLFKKFQFFTEYPVILACNCESSELLKIFNKKY
jgi:hypothetical protein